MKKIYIILTMVLLGNGYLFAQSEACKISINDGIALFNSGKYAEAKMKFEAARRINCTDAQSWINKCTAKLNTPTKPPVDTPKPYTDEENTDNRERRQQDSIRLAQEKEKQERIEQTERQEAELVIVDLNFIATTTNKSKKMNKDSWFSVSDIVIKEDGYEISRLSSKTNRESIKDRKISNTYAHVIKFKPAATTISISFTMTCNIERNSSSPLKIWRPHVDTKDYAKYIEFRFNKEHQEWEISYLDKQANPNDVPFKYFIIKDNVGFQDIDFRLNYTVRTKSKTY
ncbi:MAG: hypothetical protein LBJ63_02005 [Prevotellaceae bacterium]|jgi:hypothetical protein|nr:hypothetical protein [Prevotellaceae bacterium]